MQTDAGGKVNIGVAKYADGSPGHHSDPCLQILGRDRNIKYLALLAIMFDNDDVRDCKALWNCDCYAGFYVSDACF